MCITWNMSEPLSLSKKIQVGLSCSDIQLNALDTCYINKHMYAIEKFVGSSFNCQIMYLRLLSLKIVGNPSKTTHWKKSKIEFCNDFYLLYFALTITIVHCLCPRALFSLSKENLTFYCILFVVALTLAQTLLCNLLKEINTSISRIQMNY